MKATAGMELHQTYLWGGTGLSQHQLVDDLEDQAADGGGSGQHGYDGQGCCNDPRPLGAAVKLVMVGAKMGLAGRGPGYTSSPTDQCFTG